MSDGDYDEYQETSVVYFTDRKKAEAFLDKEDEFRVAWNIWNSRKIAYMSGYPPFVSHAPKLVPPIRTDYTQTVYQIKFEEYLMAHDEWNKKEQQAFKEYHEVLKNTQMKLGIHDSQAPLYLGSKIWIEEVKSGDDLVE
jgi:hypothetical protein